MTISTFCTPCAAPSGRPQQGFSLIELMVVVAILAILGMIAVPQYQRHAAKAKMAAALEEISIGKHGIDLMHLEDRTHSRGELDPAEIGLPLKSTYCATLTANTYEFWCTLKPDPVMGPAPHIGFLRNPHDGTWQCHGSSGSGGQDLLPDQCRYRWRGP